MSCPIFDASETSSTYAMNSMSSQTKQAQVTHSVHGKCPMSSHTTQIQGAHSVPPQDDATSNLAIKRTTAKDKLMLVPLVVFTFFVVSKVLVESRSIVTERITTKKTRKLFNLVWNLGYLYRDHDAYLLCALNNATEEWLERDVDSFRDTYNDAKQHMEHLKDAGSEYRALAETFTATDEIPTCIDGNLIELNGTDYLYKDAMYDFKKKIWQIAGRVISEHILVNNSLTFALWIFAIFFFFLWRYMETWEPNFIERFKLNKAATTFIHDVAVPIIVADKAMTIKDVNEATSKVFGWTRDEIIGENVTILMPHSLRKNHQNYVDYYVATRKAGIIGNTRGRTIAGVHKDGSTLQLVLNLSVSGNDKKQNPMFTALIQDVTEQLKAQAASKDKQAALNRIVAAQNQLLKELNAPVIIADQDMIIVQVNTAAQRTFGWTEEEMLGQNVKILMKPHDASYHESHVDRYKSTGEERVIGKTRHIKGMHRDGSEISLVLNMAKSVDATGAKYIAIFQDVTKI